MRMILKLRDLRKGIWTGNCITPVYAGNAMDESLKDTPLNCQTDYHPPGYFSDSFEVLIDKGASS